MTMKEASFYNDAAPYYRMLSEPRTAYLSAVNRVIVDRVLSSNQPLVSMLDVGGGDGVRGLTIAREAQIKQLTFVEPSIEMTGLIKQLPIPADIQSQVFQEKAEFLPDIFKNEQFDVITTLWNVLGHIPNHQLRITALQNMKHLLTKHGVLFFDVNNRYNVQAYGKTIVQRNYQSDMRNPQEKFGSNGDIYYTMHVDKRDIPAWGHVFSIEETKDLIQSAELKVQDKYLIDYDTGATVQSVGKGQLLFVCQR